MDELCPVYLRTILLYNPAEGSFTWLPREMAIGWSEHYAGTAAGSVDSGGYLQISIHGRAYLAHRLAWLLMTNEWPAHHIDHINGAPLDNRWTNLRSATRSQNMGAARIRKNNSTGYRGVSTSRNGRFVSCIRIDGKNRHLGTFDTAQEAHAAYLKAARDVFGKYASTRGVAPTQTEGSING